MTRKPKTDWRMQYSLLERDIRRRIEHALDMAVEDGGEPSGPLMCLVEKLGGPAGLARPEIAIREARLRVGDDQR